MPLLLLPCEPGSLRRPDPQFAREAEVARALGYDVAYLDHDALEATQDGSAALSRARLPEPPAAWAYRGWMMAVPAYTALVQTMQARGYRALTSADAYRRAHHGPCMASFIAPWTAASVAVPLERLDEAALRTALGTFGDGAVIVKDWVKSQAAAYWREACFIPCASDTGKALQVISRFRELQGGFLVGGIVLKAHHRLLDWDGRVGEDSAVEWRSFVVGGTPVTTFCRDERGASMAGPPDALLHDVAHVVPSPFYTMDWGVCDDGGFLLLEVGDGGVSEIPNHQDPGPLLAGLAPLLTS